MHIYAAKFVDLMAVHWGNSVDFNCCVMFSYYFMLNKVVSRALRWMETLWNGCKGDGKSILRQQWISGCWRPQICSGTDMHFLFSLARFSCPGIQGLWGGLWWFSHFMPWVVKEFTENSNWAKKRFILDTVASCQRNRSCCILLMLAPADAGSTPEPPP